MLTHDIGLQFLLTMDALTRCDSVSGFAAVDDEKSVRGTIDQHVLELGEFEC